MRTLLAVLIASHLCSLNLVNSELTESQMKTATKLLRKNCQPKTKISDETIENMHKGIWDDAPSAKCYAYCLLAFYKVVNKKGEFDEEAATAQIELLPQSRRKPTMASLQNCNRKCPDCANKCDFAYALLKCYYFDNTENYNKLFDGI